MRRLLFTVSMSALFLFALGQSVHSASTPGLSSAPPNLSVASVALDSVREFAVEFPAAIDGPARVTAGNTGYEVSVVAAADDARPIVVIQHDMPPNVELKARPRIASDLAAALREPAFTVFAAAVLFLFGMALSLLRRNL